jgi:hypothetical protein
MGIEWGWLEVYQSKRGVQACAESVVQLTE